MRAKLFKKNPTAIKPEDEFVQLLLEPEEDQDRERLLWIEANCETVGCGFEPLSGSLKYARIRLEDKRPKP